MLLKVVGMNKLTSSLDKKRMSLDDREKVNAQAVIVVDRWVQKNFESEGKMSMGGWKPLSAKTLARRRGSSAKILQDTGTMKGRWKHISNRKRGILRSGVAYAEAHHKGSGNLPERRILPTCEQIMPIIKKVYKDFVRMIIK